jgi:hypothetical protein
VTTGMTDAEPRTTSAGGGLLSAFDRAMAGLTEADVAAAFDDDPSESPAPAARPPAGEPAPDRPEPAPHRVVDPRAQEVADRLLGRNPATARGRRPIARFETVAGKR